jgi:hypothetical protein
MQAHDVHTCTIICSLQVACKLFTPLASPMTAPEFASGDSVCMRVSLVCLQNLVEDGARSGGLITGLILLPHLGVPTETCCAVRDIMTWLTAISKAR